MGADEEKPEQPKTYGPDVELTDLPDMFTMDDEEGGQRALMPCKHAIGNAITKTRPCNIQQYFTAVKMIIFR